MPLQLSTNVSAGQGDRQFQSPRSGLCLCNCGQRHSFLFLRQFQSPRSGLCLCKVLIGGMVQTVVIFQSPRSGLCLCNSWLFNANISCASISVPSFGAMPLQLKQVFSITKKMRKFQSPRSGLCLCNDVPMPLQV